MALASGGYGRAITDRFHDVQTTVDTGILFYSSFEGIEGMATDVIDGHFSENTNGTSSSTPRATARPTPSRHTSGRSTPRTDASLAIRLQGIYHLRYSDANASGQPDPARSPRSSNAAACSALVKHHSEWPDANPPRHLPKNRDICTGAVTPGGDGAIGSPADPVSPAAAASGASELRA